LERISSLENDVDVYVGLPVLLLMPNSNVLYSTEREKFLSVEHGPT